MAQIFISYRRKDGDYVARILSDRFQHRFGSGSVFMDIDNIPLGADFRSHIEREVSRCDVLVAVVGEAWARGESSKSRSRLDDPRDYVRVEIEAALSRQIPVVPVLIDAAVMPAESELPVSLQPFTFRNAAELRPGRDLKHHTDTLVEALARIFAERQQQPASAHEQLARPASAARPRTIAAASPRPSARRDMRRTLPYLVGRTLRRLGLVWTTVLVVLATTAWVWRDEIAAVLR